MSLSLIVEHPDYGETHDLFSFSREVSYDTEFLFDVYLSGPMTGVPDHNFPYFNAVAAKLRSIGLRVVNPAENFNGVTDLERSTYLRKDIALLTECKSILFLDGWRDSRGAQLEYVNARELDLLTFEYKPLGDFHELE